MSKLKRLLGALSLVALFIFSSCVDDEVAPEVAALRQAQVDLLNANVGLTNAATALTNAEAAYQTSLAAVQDAQAAKTLAEVEGINITNEEAALALAAAAVEAEADVAAAELRLQQAQYDLAQYLSTQGLQDAAYYLSLWNTVYFGGDLFAVEPPVEAPVPALMEAMDDMPAIDGGIVGLQSEIAQLKRDIAYGENYINEEEDVRQAYLDASLVGDLEEAQTDLANKTAELPAKQAALAALLNGDVPGAVSALEQTLFALEANLDTAQANKVLTAAALTAAQEGPDEALNEIVSDFESMDADFYDDYDQGGQRESYAQAVADLDADSTNYAIFATDTLAWWNYADSLQGVHDAFYEPYIVEYEAALEAAIDDTVGTWNDLQETIPTGDLESPIIDAYNDYVIKARRVLDQRYGAGDPRFPGVADEADTVAWGNARDAWDGLNLAELLENGASGDDINPDLEDDYHTYPLFDNFWGPPSADAYWLGARTDDFADSDDPFAGGVVSPGGATKAFYDNFVAGGEAALHLEAKARYFIVEDQYYESVTKFSDLQTYITEVKAGTNDDGPYDADDVPQAPTFITNFGEYDAFVEALKKVEKEILDKQRSKFPSIDAADSWYLANGYAEYMKDGDGFYYVDYDWDSYSDCEWDNLLPWIDEDCDDELKETDFRIAAFESDDAAEAWTEFAKAKAGIEGVPTATPPTVGSLSNYNWIVEFYGADVVAEYEAAVAELAMTSQAEYDERAEAIAAATAADEAAAKAVVAANAAITKVGTDIKKVYEAAATPYIMNAGDVNGGATVADSSFVDIVQALEQDIADLTGEDYDSEYNDDTLEATDGESIADADLAVEKAEVAIIQAANNQLALEDAVAADQAELAILETQLSILEAFAAELQALLEAALAG